MKAVLKFFITMNWDLFVTILLMIMTPLSSVECLVIGKTSVSFSVYRRSIWTSILLRFGILVTP